MAYIVVKVLRYLYLSVHLFIWVRYIPASKHVCFKEHPLVDGKWIFLSVHIWHFKWSPFRYHIPSGSNKLTPYVPIFQREEKHISTIYVIRPNWLGTGSWNPVPCKTTTYLFYVVNIMGTDVLAKQGAKASAAMVFSMLNRFYSVSARSGLRGSGHKNICRTTVPLIPQILW